MSILVELVEDETVGSTLDLDSIDEFKQLAPDLQQLVKDRRVQHVRAKEMNLSAKKKRAQRNNLLRRNNFADDRRGSI